MWIREPGDFSVVANPLDGSSLVEQGVKGKIRYKAPNQESDKIMEGTLGNAKM